MLEFFIGVITGFIMFCALSASVGWYYWSHPSKAVRYIFNRNDKKVAKKTAL